jgi:hypothetical protein
MSTPSTMSTGPKASQSDAPHPAATGAGTATEQSRRRRAETGTSRTTSAPQDTTVASLDADSSADTAVMGDAGLRLEMIAVSAYFRAERRGFADGSPDDDWLQAEREVDLMRAMRDAAGLPAAS